MIITHIAIRHFGAMDSFTADLDRELNLIGSRNSNELQTAIAFILCSIPGGDIPRHWVGHDTNISATISLRDTLYHISATPYEGLLRLSAADPSGADVTDFYRHTLSHCKEQDEIESFDGQDCTLPLRLIRYRNREGHWDLSRKTRYLAELQAFRAQVIQYIKTFSPEPINCHKNYQITLNPQGRFEPRYPGIPEPVHLSETEQKLFRYLCFLNIAQFWADIEKIRDLHHEKKPLIVRNFIEFLDESANIRGLIGRTRELGRQIILLTTPLDENTKQKWIGDHHERKQIPPP